MRLPLHHPLETIDMTDHRTALEKTVRLAVADAAKAYKNANPDAQGLKVRADIAAYKPRPREVQALPRAAVAMFLNEPSSVELSNAELAQKMSKGLPGKVPSNIFTERLTAAKKREIDGLLKTRNIAIDLDRFDTVSKIKGALKGRHCTASSSQFAKVEVAFTDDALVIDGKSHPIHQSGNQRRVHAGSFMLNVVGLRTLLLPGK